MTNERTLIAALVADMASAHDECLEGWHKSARDTLLGAMQAGNAFLATPAAAPEPVAWYSPRHGDTLTTQQKTERAAYLPLDAAAYSVPLFTSAPVAPALVPLTERQIVGCLVEAGCLGTVKMSYDSGPYEITRTTVNADKFARAIEAAHGIKT